MAETIISQLDRAFANPLETNRQVNFISDRDAISALRRWEGMQVYVKSELTTFELRGGILNTHWTDISGIDTANYLPNGGYTGTAQDIVDSIELTTSGVEIISITHIANLDYYVVADPYKINSNYYSAAPTTVTLTIGDATNARIDVIYADVDGLIGVLAGTPSATPVKPIVSNTQRELTFRTVPALATVDPLVTNELVFDENTGLAGGEFAVDGWNLTALNFNSTAVAFSGTKSIYFDGVDPYFNVDFKNDVNIAVSGLSSFYFRVYVTEVLDRNASFFFHCLDTSFIATGTSRTVKDGLFGFDRNVLNTWQLVSIPIAFFNLPVSEIKGIRFMVSSINKPKMYIDTMAFQFNVTQPDLIPNIYESLSNKKTDIEANKTSNTFYASVKAIYDWAVSKFSPISGSANYIQNQNASAQAASQWITGDIKTNLSITTPLIVGGSEVGSNVIYKSTTGIGTPTGIAHQWLSGTNGATVIATMLNNGNVGIGTPNPSTTLDIRTLGKGYITIGGDDGKTIVGYNNEGVSGIINIGSVNFNGFMYGSYWFDTATNTQSVRLSSTTISLWSASTERLRVANNGNILIGTTTDDTINKLQVNGSGKFTSSVQVGDNTAVASASNVGAIRYRSDANNSYADMCMLTGVATYSWVNIVTNTF